jgi:CDP-diacylglycerol---serine O-phosphatidyltransferase
MNNSKKSSRFGKFFPNYITFLSLGFGLVSIILSTQEQIYFAGLFIVVASVFDSLDGYFARRLGLESSFGLHLDSLTDMVCFGVAPILLISQHLYLQNKFTFWLLPLFLVEIWAGAFRLARFNLQPPKLSSSAGSMGMTISQGGLIIALMILSDITQVDYSYPVGIMIFLVLVLSYLMVSKVIFPPFSWFVPHPAIYGVYLVIGVILTFLFSFFTAAWILWLGILAAYISRYLFLIVRQEKIVL